MSHNNHIITTYIFWRNNCNGPSFMIFVIYGQISSTNTLPSLFQMMMTATKRNFLSCECKWNQLGRGGGSLAPATQNTERPWCWLKDVKCEKFYQYHSTSIKTKLHFAPLNLILMIRWDTLQTISAFSFFLVLPLPSSLSLTLQTPPSNRTQVRFLHVKFETKIIQDFRLPRYSWINWSLLSNQVLHPNPYT